MKTKTTMAFVIMVSMSLFDAVYGSPVATDIPAPESPEKQDATPVPDPPRIILQWKWMPPGLIKHEATARQRMIAQEHAVAFIKHLAPRKKEELKKVRFIAVETEENEQTSPKARKVVMVWDMQAESLLGVGVYDLPDPPEVGGSIAFATFSAKYVGKGR